MKRTEIDDPTRRAPVSGERRDLSCEEAFGLQHLLLEQELDPLRESWLLAHHSLCEACRRTFEDLVEERLSVLEIALDAPLLSSRFPGKVIDRVRAAKVHSARWRWARWLGGMLSSSAAAALILAAILGPFSPVSRDPAEPAVAVASLQSAGSGGLSAAEGETLEPAPELARRLPAAAAPSASIIHLADIDCFVDENECVDRLGGEDPCFSFDPASALHLDRETMPPGAPAGHASAPAGWSPAVCRCSLGEVVVFTSWVGRHTLGDSGGQSMDLRDAPCPPDPNADGKTDGSDVALYWQRLLYTASMPTCGSLPGDSAAGGQQEEGPSIGV
ncbi:MAG: hypothetical protein JXA90_15925 [Planctomycetes bacterium]|nr:hypothetical protein [Planctomycetota bacterium]